MYLVNNFNRVTLVSWQMFKIDKFTKSGFAVLQNLQKMFDWFLTARPMNTIYNYKYHRPNIMGMLS